MSGNSEYPSFSVNPAYVQPVTDLLSGKSIPDWQPYPDVCRTVSPGVRPLFTVRHRTSSNVNMLLFTAPNSQQALLARHLMSQTYLYMSELILYSVVQSVGPGSLNLRPALQTSYVPVRVDTDRYCSAHTVCTPPDHGCTGTYDPRRGTAHPRMAISTNVPQLSMVGRCPRLATVCPTPAGLMRVLQLLVKTVNNCQEWTTVTRLQPLLHRCPSVRCRWVPTGLMGIPAVIGQTVNNVLNRYSSPRCTPASVCTLTGQ